MRYGYTIAELITVMAIVIIVAAVALPPVARQLDAAAAREAADRYATAHHAARRLAGAHGRLARVELDSVRHTATISLRRMRTGWDTVEVRPLGSARIVTTQPVVTFAPHGIGFGLSNSRIVFQRGIAAETVTVARTGRLRRQ